MASAEFHQATGGASGARRAAGWLARAPRLAEWLLLALTAFFLAKAAIAFFAPLPLPKGDRLAAAGAGAAGGEDRQVTARNPFPAASEAAAPVVDATADLEETALDLGLNGVWPAEEKPSAIIRLPEGEQRRFAIGEEIVSGVRLVAVHSDHVIIEQNGVRESLRFENKAPIERPAPVQSQPVQNQPAETAQEQDPSDKIGNLPSRDMLNGLVRFGLGVDPEGGPAVMVFAGRDRAAFEDAGFRDGDIVRAINGTEPSSNPARMSELLNQISRAGSASVTIERNGVRQTLTLSLSQSGNE
ncbi:type II secretion system protein N [Hyphococcus luteus]|uniref:Type II secretion system protein GspC N-terminal domain-containing protein n=1 Tax=Hyphococcus luteus TaxID=2058213 RepID=A0A2S7K2T3_9PROT|nr:type II secretion system protein N [Marinicaulis flavus]PQA86809.1 hypothetical protein CW354_15100 [Marinicaulis flavus]